MAMYIGGSGFSGGPIGPITRGPFSMGNGAGAGGGTATGPSLPPMGFKPQPPMFGKFAPQPAPSYNATPAQATGPSNTLASQSVRPDAPPASGFDPSYLQNLATAIGGLFSRPANGNLTFNPLGDLSNISQPTGFGTAPVPGLPNTLLQDAINGLAFLFGPQASATGGGGATGGAGGGGPSNNGGGGRAPLLQ